MEKFSYGLEFYNRGWFSLDDTEEFSKAVEIADKTENYFREFTDEIETIRVNILISYKFRKDLSLEDRINYVRGISYSKQFLNEEDVYSLMNEFESKDKKIYEKSLFSIRTYSDEFDYAFYHDYIDNCVKDKSKVTIENSTKLTELVKQARATYDKIVNAPEEGIVQDNSVKLEDKEDYDDYPEEDFEDEEPMGKFSLDELSLLERLALSKEYYPVYKEGILKAKKLKEDSPSYKMVSEGMDDYNSYVTNLYEDTYNFLIKDFFRTMKNLTFVI